MARIVKAQDAPGDLSAVTLGQLTLEAGQLPYETEDPAILAAARGNRFVEVEEDEVEGGLTGAAAEADPLDPHKDASVDHLSAFASAEAIAAAEANDNAIREAVSPIQNLAAADEPSTADAVRGAFENVGLNDDPKFPSEPKQAEDTRVQVAAPGEAQGENTTPDEQVPTTTTSWGEQS